MDATTLSLPDTLQTLWRRKWLLLTCALLGGLLAFVVSLTLKPQYQAEGSLVIRSQALTAQDNDAAFNAAAVNEAVVTTEQEILTSRGLLSRVADRVVIPPDLLKEWSFVGAVESAVRTLAAAVGGPSAANWVDAQLAAISPPAADPAADLAERRLQFLSSALKVTTTKGSSVLKLKATTEDAQLSADIINQIQQFYTRDRVQEQTQTARLIEQALRARQDHTRDQISEAEERLTTALGKPGAIETSEVPGLMRDMSQLSVKYGEAQAELARRRSDYNTAIEQRALSKGDAIAFADALGGGRIPLLRQQYDNAQQDTAKLPAVDQRAEQIRASLQRQLARLQTQISAEAARVVEQRRTGMLAAQQVVVQLDKEMSLIRQKRESQVGATIALERERGAVASLWRTSDAIEGRLIDLAARPANPNARILTDAQVPPRPSFPSKMLFALAGLVLGTVTAGGYTLVSSRSQSLRLAPTALAGRLNAPFLGGIPRLRGSLTRSNRLIGSSQRHQTLAGTLAGVVLELEKKVRSGEISSLLITSGRSGEGKTTVSAWLSKALASLRLQVLLVDLDLRRPRAEATLTGSDSSRLKTETHVLDESTSFEVKVDRLTGVHLFTPRFAETDPMTMLRSEQLTRALTSLKRSYDVMILDTPPLLLVPDAIVAANFADSVLLVTEQGGANSREIEELSRRLTQTGRPIHGVVATKAEWDDPASGVYMGYG